VSFVLRVTLVLVFVMLSVHVLSVVMLSVVCAECCYAECCYAECRGALWCTFHVFPSRVGSWPYTQILD
jgi:hypothetical protein